MYQTLISAGNVLFQIMSMLLLANVIFSWIKPNRENPIVKFIYNVTEPILEPFRKIKIGGALNFSAFFAILFIEYVLAPSYRYLIGMLFL
ncbi:YggT family protein [Alkalibaculum sp. M08DMB]|uniref:YggT family protein n=1 Tax=Alkalibaculum sporogenes TaxID=2655001 RepID=A0A6A7K9N6_9FIRM|nr:YggT family protein [Alkalibaculum sporogenes]MPW26021.1 YggT family protein [Alkalibaculum sporogenes]